MSLENQMNEALENKDKLLARSCLLDMLSDNNNFKLFHEFRIKAEQVFADLYEMNQQELPDIETVKKNYDVYQDQLSKLMINFSKERLELIEAVMDSLTENKQVMQTISMDSDDSFGRNNGHRSQLNRVGIGVTVVGLALAGTGFIVSSDALAVVGGVVTLGGAAYTTIKRR